VLAVTFVDVKEQIGQQIQDNKGVSANKTAPVIEKKAGSKMA
jgi:hypothetical protein